MNTKLVMFLNIFFAQSTNSLPFPAFSRQPENYPTDYRPKYRCIIVYTWLVVVFTFGVFYVLNV